MDRLTKAACYAIEHTPGSIRALAKEAGVSHVTLVHIRGGKVRATPFVAGALRDACRQMGGDFLKCEQAITQALDQEGDS